MYRNRINVQEKYLQTINDNTRFPIHNRPTCYITLIRNNFPATSHPLISKIKYACIMLDFINSLILYIIYTIILFQKRIEY